MDKKKLLIISLLMITTVLLIGCTSNEKNTGYNNDQTYRVTYKVSGFAVGVSITYENEGGGTSQIGDTWIPWQEVMYDMHKGDFVYLSAQNNGDYGYITVEIYINGILFKSSTSTGGYVIATASGII